MKYDPKKEYLELLPKLGDKFKNSKEAQQNVILLVKNLAEILSLDPNTKLYRYIDIILNAIIATKPETKKNFMDVHKAILEQGKIEDLNDISAKVAKAAKNIWHLLHGTTSESKESPGLGEPFRYQFLLYLESIVKRYREEKYDKYALLLSDAAKRDVMAQLRGERLKVEEQESWHLANKITKRDI